MNRPLLRRAAALLSAGLLALGTAACTAGHHQVDHGEPRSTASTPTPAASAPMRVQVTHVAGTLPAAERAAVAARVRRTLSSYATAAFLSGRYPRSDFRHSFATFTSGAAARAVHDQDLLTNKPLGATTRSVRLVRGSAYLSVLAPHRHPAGATAAVSWLFDVDRGSATAQRVRLKGRLLLTKDKEGAWRIFGYDLARSATPRGSGS